MLLMEKPRRFSTDIDIVVAPGVEIDGFLANVAATWPFVRMTEQVRKEVANIEKRHFKFAFTSPLNGRELTILLDVLYEENPYSTTSSRNISNELLLVNHPDVGVRIPSANCILADKLTAFAPHTTGIPYHVDKELEIIKQLYDIAALADYIDNFAEIKASYINIVKNEIKYRGLAITPEVVLLDSLRTAFCIASRGVYHPDDYLLLKRGISSIRNHIYSENFNGEVAVQRACVVMYLAAAILTDKKSLPGFLGDDFYQSADVDFGEYGKLSYIKNTDRLAYKYLVETMKMISQVSSNNAL